MSYFLQKAILIDSFIPWALVTRARLLLPRASSYSRLLAILFEAKIRNDFHSIFLLCWSLLVLPSSTASCSQQSELARRFFQLKKPSPNCWLTCVTQLGVGHVPLRITIHLAEDTISLKRQRSC